MRAMSRAKRGSGFRGVCEYAITRSGKKEKGVIVGGNMSGVNPRELAAEFGQVRNLRADIAKPVSHNCLRLPAGERLSPEMWREVADDFMNQMGFTQQNQKVYVLHDDADGQHIHVIANRINESGGVWLGKNENLQATKIINSLELKYKLKVTVEKAGKEAKEPKKQESERAKRKNEEPPRTKIQKAIDKIFAELKTPLDIADFNRQLKKADIWLKINRASTGKINGFAFDYKGVRFKGSDLGKSYSLAGLEKRGLCIPKTHKQEQELENAKLHKIYESNSKRYEEGRARVNISDTPDLRSLPLGYVVHDAKRRAEMLLHADKNNSLGRSGYGRDHGMRRTDSGIGGARELKIIKNNTKKDSQMNTQNYIFNDSEISEFERKRLEAIRLDGWYHSVWRDKIVYKKDGQIIEDKGSKIVVDGSDYQKLAVAAVELALLKGWKLEDIRPGGEKEFIEEVNKEISKRQNLENATQNVIENVIENDTKKDTQNDDDNDGVRDISLDEVKQIIAENYDGKPIEEALKEVEAMAQEPDRGLNA